MHVCMYAGIGSGHAFRMVEVRCSRVGISTEMHSIRGGLHFCLANEWAMRGRCEMQMQRRRQMEENMKMVK